MALQCEVGHGLPQAPHLTRRHRDTDTHRHTQTAARRHRHTETDTQRVVTSRHHDRQETSGKPHNRLDTGSSLTCHEHTGQHASTHRVRRFNAAASLCWCDSLCRCSPPHLAPPTRHCTAQSHTPCCPTLTVLSRDADAKVLVSLGLNTTCDSTAQHGTHGGGTRSATGENTHQLQLNTAVQSRTGAATHCYPTRRANDLATHTEPSTCNHNASNAVPATTHKLLAVPSQLHPLV